MGFIASTVGHISAEHQSFTSTNAGLQHPLRRWSIVLGLLIVLGCPQNAWAQTALTWARIELLRNRVQLIPNGRGARTAQITDVMGIGDALRTARASRAELRFNDGSLARIGERATFRFTPNTRNFQLSNGTVLLLIPPGRGRTTIQTPNAVTGIQGSALFVRYIESSDTTIIGALTNNLLGPMVAYNASGTQEQPLNAGQIVVIEGDSITQMYDFDLTMFYETSGLIKDLDAGSVEGVEEEMMDALREQQALEGEVFGLENPSFISAPVASRESDSTSLEEDLAFADFPAFTSSPANSFHQEFTAQQRPASRYPQNTAEATLPVSPVNSSGQAHQVNATRQQQNNNGIVAATPVASTPISTDGTITPANPNIGNSGVDIDNTPNDNPSLQPPAAQNPTQNPGADITTPTVPTDGVITPGDGGNTPPSSPVDPTPVPNTPTTPPPIPEPVIPDTTVPPIEDSGAQPPTRPGVDPGGSPLDWDPNAVPGNIPSEVTVPTTEAASPVLLEGPAPEATSEEILSNPANINTVSAPETP